MWTWRPVNEAGVFVGGGHNWIQLHPVLKLLDKILAVYQKTWFETELKLLKLLAVHQQLGLNNIVKRFEPIPVNNSEQLWELLILMDSMRYPMATCHSAIEIFGRRVAIRRSKGQVPRFSACFHLSNLHSNQFFFVSNLESQG